jgi:SAM-dependent methyltransferase
MSMCDYSNMPAHGIRDVVWVAGAARALPFPYASMDAVVCAFGIRNVTYVDPTSQEVFRVLKTGGRFFCLEVSRPWAPIRPFYYAFCRYLVPRLGAWVIPLPEIYEYLVDSILNFPGHKEIKHLLEETGFTNMSCHRLTMESYASILTPIAYLNGQQNKPGHVTNTTELPHRKKEKKTNDSTRCTHKQTPVMGMHTFTGTVVQHVNRCCYYRWLFP